VTATPISISTRRASTLTSSAPAPPTIAWSTEIGETRMYSLPEARIVITPNSHSRPRPMVPSRKIRPAEPGSDKALNPKSKGLGFDGVGAWAQS
jgi:hypothetical protein